MDQLPPETRVIQERESVVEGSGKVKVSVNFNTFARHILSPFVL